MCANIVLIKKIVFRTLTSLVCARTNLAQNWLCLLHSSASVLFQSGHLTLLSRQTRKNLAVFLIFFFFISAGIQTLGKLQLF